MEDFPRTKQSMPRQAVDPVMSSLDLSSFVVFRKTKNVPAGMQLAPEWDGQECLRLCNDGLACARRESGACPFTHLSFRSKGVADTAAAIAPFPTSLPGDSGEFSLSDSNSEVSSSDCTPRKKSSRRRHRCTRKHRIEFVPASHDLHIGIHNPCDSQAVLQRAQENLSPSTGHPSDSPFSQKRQLCSTSQRALKSSFRERISPPLNPLPLASRPRHSLPLLAISPATTQLGCSTISDDIDASTSRQSSLKQFNFSVRKALTPDTDIAAHFKITTTSRRSRSQKKLFVPDDAHSLTATLFSHSATELLPSRRRASAPSAEFLSRDIYIKQSCSPAARSKCEAPLRDFAGRA
eukprot:gb/GEZN01008210.1/.p1 GENE.gb/GEZN01008210.1/~~gb/GEZN01008210.1/.p1  ORF type:complete len:350 (-),score=25.24 gb/GEZN01008210.1/:402-1451(-)